MVFGFQNRINYWEENMLTFLVHMTLAVIFLIKNDEVGFLLQRELQWVWAVLFHFPGHVDLGLFSHPSFGFHFGQADRPNRSHESYLTTTGK